MAESKEKAVPRFTSFRPKVQESYGATQNLRRPTSDADLLALEKEVRKEDVDHDNDHHYHYHRKHHERKRKRPDPETPLQTSKTTHVSSTDSSNIFIIDQSGDQKNVAYRSLHRYAIPKHRRIGAGSVVGSYQKIDRAGSDAQVVILSDPSQNDARCSGPLKSWKPSKHQREEFVNRWGPSKDLGPIERTLDFLPLDIASSKQIPDDLGGAENSDDSLEDEETIRAAEQGELKEKRGQKAKLWQSAWAKRTDPEAWLIYIDWLEARQSSVWIASELAINTHTITSTYEQALEQVKDEKSQESLILRMMRRGRNTWNEKETQERWRKYSERHPSSQILWQHYVDCHQTSSDFHHKDFLILYDCRLKFLQAKRDEVEANLGYCRDDLQKKQLRFSQASIYLNQVQTLLRFTLALRDAGYIEHGIAIWQAILELNFYRPPKYRHLRNAATEEREGILASLEDFWESGAPRIGEKGGRGWCEFVQSEQSTRDPQKDAVQPIAQSSSTWTTWAELENRSASLDSMPARYEDDINEDDNARVIMFSDLKMTLFIAPSEGPEVLVNAFLIFCHFPPLGEPCQEEGSIALGGTDRPHGDPFLQGHLLDKRPKSLAEISSHPVMECQSSQYRRTPEMYLDSHDWFSPFSVLDGTNSDLQTKHFGARVLVQLVSSGRDLAKVLGTYYIGLESRLSPDRVEKTARKLFRRFKSDPGLSDVFCNAYAHVLARLGRWDAARSIFEMAIQVGDRAGAQMGSTKIQHLHALVSGCLERNNVSGARKILIDEIHRLPTTAQDLDVVQEGQLHSLLLMQNYIQALHCNMQAAIDVHEAFENQIPPNFLHSTTVEICHQYKAKLLYHDALHPPSSLPPIRMREQLALSISRFPHNVIFQTLYMWNERRCGAGISLVANAVLHSPYSDSRANGESTIPHILAISNAISQGVSSEPSISVNPNGIRNVFERAVASSTGRFCPGIWYWYLLWEFLLARASHSSSTSPRQVENVKRQTLEQSRRHAIWWRAISACPWVKSIPMLAFEEENAMAMGMAGKDHQLKGIFEIMEERELRVRMRKAVPART